MPKVHFVKKARKDHPPDIKKGESYYHWKFRYGGIRRSKTRPKPSQLTQSEFLSQLYDLQERRDAVCEHGPTDDFDSFKTEIEDIADEIESLGEECSEKHDNMPEQLQDGDVGQLLEERASRCEDMAQELRDAVECSGAEDYDPEADVLLECPHCKDESHFPVEFRGAYNCTECEKDFHVTDEMMNEELEKRQQEYEDSVQSAIDEIEGVDMDCD